MKTENKKQGNSNKLILIINKLNKRISLRNKFIEYKLKSITDIELSNLRNHLKKNPDTLNIFDPEKP